MSYSINRFCDTIKLYVMRNPISKILFAGTILCISAGMLFGQTSKVTFTVDMSDADVANPATVGIRGSLPPLSWEENFIMKGPDKDGLYTTTVTFENVPPGTRVQYKYYHDGKWDNDSYIDLGNRVVALCCKKQKLPVDKWDQLNEFALEGMLKATFDEGFGNWIFVIGLGKKHGLTPEQLVDEHFAFWNTTLDWITSPEDFARIDRFNMARSPYGYFELIESTPNKVEYVIKKDWELYFRDWGKDNVINGVSMAEMTAFIKAFTERIVDEKGWKLGWLDEGENLKITVNR